MFGQDGVIKLIDDLGGATFNTLCLVGESAGMNKYSIMKGLEAAKRGGLITYTHTQRVGRIRGTRRCRFYQVVKEKRLQ